MEKKIKDPALTEEEFGRTIRERADGLRKGRKEMAFDLKKEYREFYMPKNRPEIVTIPPMNYAAVRGKGDLNVEGGNYLIPKQRRQINPTGGSPA